jgi:hypothetical protein
LGQENESAQLHIEVLGSRQRKVIRNMGALADRAGFYLAGGTALALQLGHRHSVDYDWFTTETLADPIGLADRMRESGLPLQITRAEEGALHCRINEVRVSFIEYRYPLIAPLVEWTDEGCSLASLDDIAAMKLAAVAQRGSRKDIIDVYALALRHKPISQLLSLYKKRYKIQDVTHVLYALTYFDDADKERTPTMLWDVNWRAVKAAMKDWIQETAR